MWGIFLAYVRRRLSSRFRFHVFWEAEHDRVFLILEPGFRLAILLFSQEDLVLTSDQRQVIFTLQYTYTIHMKILTPFGIDRPSFGISFLIC